MTCGQEQRMLWGSGVAWGRAHSWRVSLMRTLDDGQDLSSTGRLGGISGSEGGGRKK